MGSSDLSVRFTEDVYASRREVSQALGTSLIDPIWKNILLYRSKFAHHLGLFDISKASYQITFTLSVVNKINSLKAKLSRAIVSFGKLEDNSIEKYAIRREAIKDALRNVAANNSLIVNDVALENILEEKPVSKDFKILVDYYAALKQLKAKPLEPIDESLMAQYYGLLNGEEELTSFYRISDFKAPSQKLVIGREYNCAPYSMIETLMKNLFDYISLNINHDYLMTAIIAFYQLNYIKPFPKLNEEMSIILFKTILAQSDLQSLASIMPIEVLIGALDKRIHDRSREVQKTRDLTYIVIAVLDAIDDVTSKFLDLIVVKEKDTAKNVYFGGDDDEEFKEEFGVSRDEVAPIKVAIEETPKEEVKETYSEPIIEKVKVEEKVERVTPHATKIERAYQYEEEEVVDEKLLRRQENDLLESDPLLRPHMAHFYVRHNVVGKFYTIQQYKKAERTVYETARTAMDTLAKRGYYRREQVKNKFVYTPIKK